MKLWANSFKVFFNLPQKVKTISLSYFLDSLGGFVTTLLAIILTQKKGLSLKEAGYFLSLLGFIGISTTLWSSHLADRLGARKLYILLNLCSAICMLLCWPFFDHPIFFVCITLWPLFKRASGPIGQSLIISHASGAQKKQVINFIYMLTNLSNTFAPLIAIWLYKHNLPLVFLIDGITTLIATCIIFIAVKKETIIKEKKGERLYKLLTNVLKNRKALLISTGIYLINFVHYQHIFSLPTNLASQGLETYFGYIMSFNCLLVAAFSGLLAIKTNSWSSQKSLLWGGLFIGIGFFILRFDFSIYNILLSTLFWSVGEIIFYTHISHFILTIIPSKNLTLGLSILPTIFSISNFLNPLILGFLIDSFGYSFCWSISPIIVFTGVSFLIFSNKSTSYTTRNL